MSLCRSEIYRISDRICLLIFVWLCVLLVCLIYSELISSCKSSRAPHPQPIPRSSHQEREKGLSDLVIDEVEIPAWKVCLLSVVLCGRDFQKLLSWEAQPPATLLESCLLLGQWNQNGLIYYFHHWKREGANLIPPPPTNRTGTLLKFQ